MFEEVSKNVREVKKKKSEKLIGGEVEQWNASWGHRVSITAI